MFAKNKKLAAVALVALAWGALFYSSRGLLVWQWADEEDHRLSCWYLSATGGEKRTHLYTESGILGRSECPRTIEIR